MERFLALLTSVTPHERELATYIFTNWEDEPGDSFLPKIIGLLGTVSHDATLAILTLLMENDCCLNEHSLSPIFDLLKSSDNTLRLAAFHFIKETGTSPYEPTLYLDTFDDDVVAIRKIAEECLHEVILYEDTAFEVAEYLRHDNPEVREAARELLLSGGQEDLLDKMSS